MDAESTALTLSSCLAEIAAKRIPWAGDADAGFDTGLYAVLDHIDEGASALLYFRPQQQQFLLYVYVPSQDELAASDVALAVTRYLQHGEIVRGGSAHGEPLPGSVLYELDKLEARRRLAALRRALDQPAGDDVIPYLFH